MVGESSAARGRGWNGGGALRGGGEAPAGGRREAGELGRLVGAVVAWASAGVATVRVWLERARQRRALAMLDDRLLRDIGLTRDDVGAEIRKPFWRV